MYLTECICLSVHFAGVAKDQVRGLQLYKLAADKGETNAMYNLARAHTNGNGNTFLSTNRKYLNYYIMVLYKGISKDLTLAKKYFMMAVDGGCADAIKDSELNHLFNKK